MSHKLKVEVRPEKNKDGSPSKTKKRYMIFDRTRRGGKTFIDSTPTKKQIPELLDEARRLLREDHLRRHPNDIAFRRKHGL